MWPFPMNVELSLCISCIALLHQFRSNKCGKFYTYCQNILVHNRVELLISKPGVSGEEHSVEHLGINRNRKWITLDHLAAMEIHTENNNVYCLRAP